MPLAAKAAFDLSRGIICCTSVHVNINMMILQMRDFLYWKLKSFPPLTGVTRWWLLSIDAHRCWHILHLSSSGQLATDFLVWLPATDFYALLIGIFSNSPFPTFRMLMPHYIDRCQYYASLSTPWGFHLSGAQGCLGGGDQGEQGLCAGDVDFTGALHGWAEEASRDGLIHTGSIKSWIIGYIVLTHKKSQTGPAVFGNVQIGMRFSAS